MNQRIQELVVQAGGNFANDSLKFAVVFGELKDFEKFAELIVKECAEICYHHSEAAGGVDTAFGYGYKDCGNDIKKHFGVEQ